MSGHDVAIVIDRIESIESVGIYRESTSHVGYDKNFCLITTKNGATHRVIGTLDEINTLIRASL